MLYELTCMVYTTSEMWQVNYTQICKVSSSETCKTGADLTLSVLQLNRDWRISFKVGV